MKGIKFNNIHSYKDLNLILSSVSIPPAAPKTTYIDIPGTDGSVDQTEAFGEVKFNDRDCEFVFSVLPHDDFEKKKTEISNLLNGQVCKITLDKDADYYYQGRCIVDNYKSDKMLRQIVVKAKTFPYKYKKSITTRSWVISSTKNLVDRLGMWKLYASASVKNDILTISSAGGIATSPDILLTDISNFSLSCKTKMQSIRIYLMWYDENGKVTSTSTFLQNGVSENISVPTNAVKVNVRVNPSSISSYPIELANFQVEASKSCSSYEPKDGFVAANDRKTVVPNITVTNDDTVISINGLTATLSKGTHKLLNFQLFEGDNIITALGNGTVTLEYQEGAL